MRVELAALVARGNVQVREVAVASDLHVEVCAGRASARSSEDTRNRHKPFLVKSTPERVPSGIRRALLRGCVHHATSSVSVSEMLPRLGGAKRQKSSIELSESRRE
jgi:hypothetical protein